MKTSLNVKSHEKLLDYYMCPPDNGDGVLLAAIYPSRRNKTHHSGGNTLYVISIHQMRQAVKAAEELEVQEEQIDLYREKISLLQQQTAEKDSLQQLHQEDALFYKNNWQKAEKDVQQALDEARKQRRHKFMYGAGGLLIGLAISFL
ncbi:MAG: hypothetical protein U5L09_11145 [Bacteroidales bacterium]|nr:hypothetical protein [Bacteroidales bacterium]